MTADAGKITVTELLNTLQQRRARLPAEIGAFVALRCLEQCAGEPGEVSPEGVELTDAGEVLLTEKAQGASQEAVARSIVGLLGRLLVAAGSGIPPMMLSLVEQGSGDDGQSLLDSLRGELEASLVPLNRSASERVLARLVRDSIRGDIPAGEEPLPQDSGRLDEGVDALLEGREGPSIEPSLQRSRDLDIAAVTGRARPKSLGDSADHSAEPSVERSEDASHAQSVLGGSRDLHYLDRAPSTGGTNSWFLLAVVIFSALIAGYALGWFDGAADTSPERTTAETSSSAAVAEDRRRTGDLIVRAQPARSQVFLLVGRGEASVPGLDISLDHEFAVVMPGNGATRQILPRCVGRGNCSHWVESADGWRAELRVEGGQDDADDPVTSLGNSRLVGDLGQGGSATGEARIVAASPEAMIYRFEGHTPSVRVESLGVDTVHRLLIVAPGRMPQFLELQPSAWRDIAGVWTAELEANLEARP